MLDNREKIRKERVKNIVHLVRLSPDSNQDEMITRFTKGEPQELVDAVKRELSKFEIEYKHLVTADDVRVEDGGMAKMIVIPFTEELLDSDDGMYLEIVSWSDAKDHKQLDKLIGKRVKIIIREVKD